MYARFALVVALSLSIVACGGRPKPIKIAFHVGESKTFDAAQLPADSTLTCRVVRQEDGQPVPYSDTIDVPAWSSWNANVTYGWMQSSVVGDIYFGIRSEKRGKLLRVSCAHTHGSNGLG
jgi:hypothetical protein